MAIIDVRELRSFEYGESLGEKGKITLAGSVDLLALHDATPDFGALAEDSTSWANLGNATIPKVGETRLVAGVLFTVKTRKMSYYKGDDADRAVKISVTYEAQDEDSEQPEPGDSEDAETWKRISVSTEQKECPLTNQGITGTLNSLPPKNSAGDPFDGLTETRSLLRLKYTNTKVRTPNFANLNTYVNTTNDEKFLGAIRLTVLCIGYNADYDDKTGLWAVTVEWLYDPHGHWVEVWDAGFNQIVNDKRQAIVDNNGHPVGKPVPLNGAGQAVAASLIADPYLANTNMVKLYFYPYVPKRQQDIFVEGGI